MGKGGPIKDIEAVYRLALDKDFRKDVHAARERATLGSLLVEAVSLLQRYNVSVGYYRAMIHFIANNRFESDADPDKLVLDIHYPDKGDSKFEEALKALKEPYVGVYIYDVSSKEEVFRVINKNWKGIQASLKSQGKNISRTRSSSNKVRNLLISELCEKSKAELADIAGEKLERAGMYKEQLVAQIMREQFNYREVTFDMVRKYSAKRAVSTDKSRIKRSIKGKQK